MAAQQDMFTGIIEFPNGKKVARFAAWHDRTSYFNLNKESLLIRIENMKKRGANISQETTALRVLEE